jgi:hypothetical protein
MVSLFFFKGVCLRKLFVNGDFILLCFSPDGNEKPAKEKQIDFVAKKERPKKLLFFAYKIFVFPVDLKCTAGLASNEINRCERGVLRTL